MKRYLNISFIVFGVIAISGCYYDNEEELYPSNFCDVTTVTFSGTIKPLIQAKCAIPGCHVTGGQSPNFTSDAVIGQNSQGIRARAVEHVPSPMPPSGPLPNCEIQQLQAWLDAGAPINN